MDFIGRIFACSYKLWYYCFPVTKLSTKITLTSCLLSWKKLVQWFRYLKIKKICLFMTFFTTNNYLMSKKSFIIIIVPMARPQETWWPLKVHVVDIDVESVHLELSVYMSHLNTVTLLLISVKLKLSWSNENMETLKHISIYVPSPWHWQLQSTFYSIAFTK